MTKSVTKIDGEVFTHRILWSAAERLGEAAEQKPLGPFYGCLTSMLMAYFTVEAYVNFLLEVLDPELFADERKVFRSSLGAKIEWACSRADLKLDKGSWPYQTIAELEELRHKVVHAKPDRYAERLENVDPDTVPMFREGELERLVSPDEWTNALAAVNELCEWLHQPLIGLADPDQRLRLQNFALKGTTHMQTLYTSVTPSA